MLTFCDRASDLLGMDIEAVGQLWQFFSEQTRKPSKAIVLHTPPSVFGPDNMDKLLTSHGIHPDGHTEGSFRLNESDFERVRNAMRRLIEAVMNVETCVVVTLSGNMVLPLFAPGLACDFRIAASDFCLINRLLDYIVTPMGGLPWFLTRAVGRRQAADLIGRPHDIHAEEAARLGLVESSVPQADLLNAAIALAQDTGDRPYGNSEAIKQCSRIGGESLEEYFVLEEVLFRKSIDKLRARNCGKRVASE